MISGISYCGRPAMTTSPEPALFASVVPAYVHWTRGADAWLSWRNASCTAATPPVGAPAGLTM
jgi:hypothetical protein